MSNVSYWTYEVLASFLGSNPSWVLHDCQIWCDKKIAQDEAIKSMTVMNSRSNRGWKAHDYRMVEVLFRRELP